MFLADVKMGMFDGIVYPVMDVEGGNILIANPGRTHVCLVCDDQGSGDGIYRKSGAFIVISDEMCIRDRIHPRKLVEMNSCFCRIRQGVAS